MKYAIINPCTGPVQGANLKDAEKNVAKLIEDCNFEFNDNIIVSRVESDDKDGRYSFLLTDVRTECECDIDMPGSHLLNVRFVGDKDQNIWDFPRLYVDGSSWVWKYAILSVRRRFLDGTLDPCPFCGECAELVDLDPDRLHIACTCCGARLGDAWDSDGTRESLTLEWNKRA